MLLLPTKGQGVLYDLLLKDHLRPVVIETLCNNDPLKGCNIIEKKCEDLDFLFQSSFISTEDLVISSVHN